MSCYICACGHAKKNSGIPCDTHTLLVYLSYNNINNPQVFQKLSMNNPLKLICIHN